MINPDITFAASAQQLADRLEELGQVSDEPGRLVRTFLSPASLRANALVGGWMREAGLTVREDAFGNLIGTRPGPAGSRTLVIGSHLDTVVDAGRFDGPAGVLLGIAVAEALPELPFTLEVAGFSDEEGVRFQSTYLGSRAYAGLITEEELALRDTEVVSVGELVAARRAAGFPDNPAAAPDLLGYLEIHIEQGRCWKRPACRWQWCGADPDSGRIHRKGRPCRHHAHGAAPRCPDRSRPPSIGN